MTFISYAQNYEDVILWRALNDVEAGFYIDVGACWPDEHSVTRSFYERGWSGINIEPNPEFLQQLLEKRDRDTNLGFAISDKNGHGRITILKNTGLSTMDDAVARMHMQSGYNAVKQDVDIVTLQYVCENYVPSNQPLHFLKIDVEGFEEQVIRGNDWWTFRPWIVLVEATVPLSQTESYENWESILENADYRFCYADGLNRFYVAEEHADLVDAFKYPPNVFDDFRTYAHSCAEGKALEEEQHRIRAEQLQEKYRIRVERLQEEHQIIVGGLQNELQAVYSSKSWRLTRPVRLVTDMLRRLTTKLGAFQKQVMFRVANLALRISWLRSIILALLDRFPRFKEPLRKLSGIRAVADDASREAGSTPRSETQLTCGAREVVEMLECSVKQEFE